MPLLNKHGEPVAVTSVSDGAPDAGGTALVTLEEWAPGSGDGVVVPVDAEPHDELTNAPLIAIDFPAFNDGRGLSLAVLLRTRHGFKGELRAVGDVHPDLVHYMQRCGFDTFLMPEGRTFPGSNAQSGETGTFAPHSDYYQASVSEPEPAFRRVSRGA